MSRATISTGQFSLDTKTESRTLRQNTGGNDKACHILIISDFSGSAGKKGELKNRPIIEIDRDNFDDVFAQMQVQLSTIFSDSPLKFSELDDMHPDYLYENVDIFNRFRALKKKLKSPQTFEAAASEIYQWHQERSDKASQPSSTPEAAESEQVGGSLLDNILQGEAGSETNSGFNIQALVKDIVAPYVTPKPDPQQKELMATVDSASSQLMRKLMHSSEFQKLESAWRSLYLLVKRVETDSKLKLFVLDAAQKELANDLIGCTSIESSDTCKLIVDKRSSVGGTPFTAVMVDSIFGENLAGIRLAEKLAQVVEKSDALLVAGGSEQLAGCESLAITPDQEDWSFTPSEEVVDAWNLLRASPASRSLSLVAPRFLVRMPFGKKTAPIDSFNFEELPPKFKHAYYLWSNGAWLQTLILAQNFTICGDIANQQVQEVDRLPLHVHEEGGESLVTPCAEINMLDSAAIALTEAGLNPLRSVLNKDSVVLPALLTVSN